MKSEHIPVACAVEPSSDVVWTLLACKARPSVGTKHCLSKLLLIMLKWQSKTSNLVPRDVGTRLQNELSIQAKMTFKLWLTRSNHIWLTSSDWPRRVHEAPSPGQCFVRAWYRRCVLCIYVRISRLCQLYVVRECIVHVLMMQNSGERWVPTNSALRF